MGGGLGRVVIVSAGVGLGHHGSTRELARRLVERGYVVDEHDFIDLLPGPTGSGSVDLYNRMLNHAPWVYASLFQIGTWSATAAVTRAMLRPARVRLGRLLGDEDVRAVVSMYSLASQLLGPLRRSGQLRVPALTYVTDFAVHQHWVVSGVDALLTPHAVGAGQARALGANPAAVQAAGALVAPGFHPAAPDEQAEARRIFGLPPGRLALVAAGSWGVGRVEATAADVAASGVAKPVVVCGRNEHLRARLERAGVPALGWVDDMPMLMRAVDVLVENAGGLMALEGMATGLPVATYRPIPGHGHVSAATLERAGVSTWVRRRDALAPTLVRLLDGDLGPAQRSAAEPMLRADPADLVAQLAASHRPPATGRPGWRDRSARAGHWKTINVAGSKSTVGADEAGRDRRQ